MKILMIGDIFSKPGRNVIEKKLKWLVKEEDIDFVVANGENVSHGRGLNKEHFKFLKDNGVNVVTGGNHSLDHQDFFDLNQDPTYISPLNMNPYLNVNGSNVFTVKSKKIRVTNLLGRTFMQSVENPYYMLEEIISNDNSDIHLVDFHAEATAEKAAFANYFDGKITAFVGTHTHVQTADERILPKGTAFITDLGMTGDTHSIIGLTLESVISKEKQGLPTKFVPSDGENTTLNGLIIETNDLDNKVKSIKRLSLKNK